MPSRGLTWDLSPAYLCRNWLFKVIGGRTSNLVGLALRGGEGLGKSVSLMVSLTGSNLVADLKNGI